MQRRFLRLAVTASAILAAVYHAVAPESALAQWRSLTGLLPEHVSFAGPVFSSNSKYVVYMADKDIDEVRELYSVPVSGTVGPVKLNSPLVTDGEVIRFAVSPNSQYVVYSADQDVDNRVDLYSVPISGGTPIQLNGAMVAGGNVQLILIDPDTQRVVFTADKDTNDVIELYSVPITGGTPVKLNPPTGPGDVFIFDIDTLSNRVVFMLDDLQKSRYSLFSTPLIGGSPTRLAPSSARVDSFRLDPIIPIVVYAAGVSGNFDYEVFSVPTAGGPANAISAPLAANQRARYFYVSPGGDRVVYELSAGAVGTTTRTIHMYSALIGGGGLVQLTSNGDPILRQGPFDSQGTVVFTPNGQRVVYLHTASPSPSAPRQLRSGLTAGGGAAVLYMPSGADTVGLVRTSSDSQWVVFGVTSSGVQALHAVPPQGGSDVLLANASSVALAPDASRVAYYTNRPDYGTDVESVQIFGGGRRNLSDMGGFGFALSPQYSPDGAWVMFGAQLISAAPERRVLGYELRISDGTAAQAVQPPLGAYSVRLPLVMR